MSEGLVPGFLDVSVSASLLVFPPSAPLPPPVSVCIRVCPAKTLLRDACVGGGGTRPQVIGGACLGCLPRPPTLCIACVPSAFGASSPPAPLELELREGSRHCKYAATQLHCQHRQRFRKVPSPAGPATPAIGAGRREGGRGSGRGGAGRAGRDESVHKAMPQERMRDKQIRPPREA